MGKNTPADPLREAHFADLMDLHTACFINEGENAEEALGRMRELIKSRRTALVTKSAETVASSTKAPMTLAEQVKDARSAVASWSPEYAQAFSEPERRAPEPEWPQKRDLAASIRVSQQRYEIDVMWNNAIDLCRAAIATNPAEPAAKRMRTITERELAFALNYHSDDSRINDADWKIARRYFEVIESNRGTHPSLLDHPTENAGKSPIAEPDLTDEQIDAIFDAQFEEYGQLCDRLDMQMFARSCVRAALTHRRENES